MALDFTGQVMDNIILSKIDAPLGTYRQSDLTLAQFQANAIGVWVLANGGSCSGSAYEALTGKSNVPDMRATVPRMKDNARGLNPDGDLTLGAYQADNFGSHTHVQNAHTHVQNSHNHTQNAHGHDILGAGGGIESLTSSATRGVMGANTGGTYDLTSGAGTAFIEPTTAVNQAATAVNQNTTAVNQNTGGNETRMKSTTVNFFIKIGY